MRPAISFALALLAGAVSVFAFAPFGLWPLQSAAFALLFLLILRAASSRAAMQLGWAFAFAAIGCGTHWLYVSLHDYGGLPAPLTILALALLAACLAVLYGLAMAAASWLVCRTQNQTLATLLVMPACWMLADWTRSWIFTGFPWLATGYAHTASPLAAYAPLLGVYGVGWLATLIAACLTVLIGRRQFSNIAVALLIMIPAAGIALQSVMWTTPLGKPLSVRLLQGNIPQDLKFNLDQLKSTLNMYQHMVSEAPADLIATPETALPLLASQLPPSYFGQWASFTKETGSTVIVGVPVSTGPGIYLNSVIGIADGNANAYRYDKHHLVPFGEFIPPGARWFVELMQIPLGDFTRGSLLQPPMKIKDQWLLPNICYEDLFGEEIAQQLQAAHMRHSPQASILLNVSNIAWFGDTIALPQHLQISQMRTLETGRPMLRATNTGATAVIDASGKLVASLPPFTRGTLAAKVQGMQGQTPYIVLGNSTVAGLAALILLLFWWPVRRRPPLAS
ncbi:MAG: apolipoprotein N-acyltransferase [Burkholderiaceae bacterium]